MLMPMILENAKIYKFEHIEVLVARYKLYNPPLSSMLLIRIFPTDLRSFFHFAATPGYT